MTRRSFGRRGYDQSRELTRLLDQRRGKPPLPFDKKRPRRKLAGATSVAAEKNAPPLVADRSTQNRDPLR